MRVLVVDVYGMPSTMQVRAVRQLSAFRGVGVAVRFRIPVAHFGVSGYPSTAFCDRLRHERGYDVRVYRRDATTGDSGDSCDGRGSLVRRLARDMDDVDATDVSGTDGCKRVFWWLVLTPVHRTWEDVQGANETLDGIMRRHRDWAIVLTASRTGGGGAPPHRGDVESFVGVRAPYGLRLPALPLGDDAALTHLDGRLLSTLTYLCEDRVLGCDALPPAVTWQLDVGTLVSAQVQLADGVSPFDLRRLWIRGVVPRPDRCSNVAVVVAFSLADVANRQANHQDWQRMSDAERSHWMATHGVEHGNEWSVPVAFDVRIFDQSEDVDEVCDLWPTAGASERQALECVLELVGASLPLHVPSDLWLRAPVDKASSILVGGDDRSAWLPLAVRARLPPAAVLPPVCTVLVPNVMYPALPPLDLKGATSGVSIPHDWVATGEHFTYVCADHVVYALVVTPRARRAASSELAPSAGVAVRGSARTVTRRK